jgi:hypothetical protein
VIFGDAGVVNDDGNTRLSSRVDRLRIGPSQRPCGEVRIVPTTITRKVCGKKGASRVCLAVRDIRRVGCDTIHCRTSSNDGRWVDRHRSSGVSHCGAKHGSKF